MTHSTSFTTFSFSTRLHLTAKHIGLVIAVGGAAWVLRFATIVGTQDAAQVQPLAQVLWLLGGLLLGGLAWGITQSQYFADCSQRVARPASSGWVARPSQSKFSTTESSARRAGWLGRSAAFLVGFVVLAALMAGCMGVIHTTAHTLLHDAPHYVINEVPTLVLGCAGLALAPLFWIEWDVESK